MPFPFPFTFFSSNGIKAPKNLTPVLSSVGNIIVQWSAVAGATSYDVQSSPDNATWSTISTAQTALNYADTAATATGTTSGIVYYRVRANAGGLHGPYCNSVNACPWIVFDNTTAPDNTLITAYSPSTNLEGLGHYLNPSTGGFHVQQVQIIGNKITPLGTQNTDPKGWSFTLDTVGCDPSHALGIQFSLRLSELRVAGVPSELA